MAWLAIAPLLGSLALRPLRTALLAGWTVLLGLGLALKPAAAGRLASSLGALALLAGFAVANSVLRSAAQRRLGQARAVARVAQSALLREVPTSVAAARLASRYLSASAEARVGGDVVEVIADGPNPRWLVGDTRGKGLAAVRLASVAATSFRDACAQPGLSLTEVARAVDLSVTRAAGDEDFVTAVFAELDPRGWLQLVNCGHPPPLRLSAGGKLAELAPGGVRHPAGPAPGPAPVDVLGTHRRPAAVLHRRAAGGPRPDGPVLPHRPADRRAAPARPAGGRRRAARPAARAYPPPAR